MHRVNTQPAQRLKEETAAEGDEQEQHRVLAAALGKAVEIEAVGKRRAGFLCIHLGGDVLLRDVRVMRAVVHETVEQLQRNQQDGADNGMMTSFAWFFPWECSEVCGLSVSR